MVVEGAEKGKSKTP